MSPWSRATRIAMAAAAVLLACDALAAGGRSVIGSKHDLSVTGPGPIKAVREANACVFCHVMHGGAQKLSGRPDPSADHRPYESTTMRGAPRRPSGVSRVCLSCHDGTIAVGQTRKGRIEMEGGAGGRIPPGRRSHLGTDLRQSHPFSIPTGDAPGTRRPPSRSHVKLDAGGLVQCTSCHDPHAEFGGSTEGKFLVERTLRSELCVTCHSDAMTSSHLTSTIAWPLAKDGGESYATVADAGCAACHRSHGAATKGQLLRLEALDADEAACLRCHTAGTGAADIARAMAKPSSHAAGTNGKHDAAEGPSSKGQRLPEVTANAPRHATCVDCHDPHQASRREGTAHAIAGALDGVWGIDDAGRRVEVATAEWQICLKCHGDSRNQKGAWGRTDPSLPRRAAADANLRRVFSPSAPSSHPVIAAGRNPDVPSLKAPLGPTSQIRCSDCHSADDARDAGGSGPRGPHGSLYRPLLERNYSTADRTPESPAAYALCYKCHDRDVLLSDRSAFPLHRRHVVDRQSPCSACHSAHGVSASAGTALHNAHLVDFDQSIVKSAPDAYTTLGPRAGTCSLTCHGTRHDAARY